jgi:metal-dependent amidase/aminoacylase/carboxypeptidase family protein
VVLRSDIDGLPISEEGSAPVKWEPCQHELLRVHCCESVGCMCGVHIQNAWTCRSEHDGQGHMCGHDGHMAMLLGGARLLHDAESSLKV